MSGTLEHAVKPEDTFTLLDSRDLAVVEGIRRLILEQLSTGKEPWLVVTLVDHYYVTGSLTARDILAEIREPLDKVLVDKIQEGMRTPNVQVLAMQLLLFLVDRQPPWIHSLVERPIFSVLLKLLKTETDVPMLMTCLMVLAILLPVVPVSIGNHLQDVFEIFARVAGLVVKKPANVPEVFILHLHIAVYVLFLRLYGMFPCTFLTFLRTHFTKKEHLMVYSDVINPMLEKVRFNPLLVGGSNDPETSKSRWKKLEPQDIVVNCAKLSLDPIEGTIEELHCPILPQPIPEIVTIMKPPSRSQKPPDTPWQEKMEKVSELFPVVIDPACYVFSPSQLLGLSTPPTSQRATPAASFMDLTTSHQQSTTGTMSASPQVATPVPEAVVREMPTMGEETDKVCSQKETPVPQRTGPKNTPVQFNRTQGSSAFTSPLISHSHLTASQPPSIGPSPFKPLAVNESPGLWSNTSTARALHFGRSQDSKTECTPKLVGALVEMSGPAASVPVDSLPAIIRTLSAQDNDQLDQEVSQITEIDEVLSPSENTTPDIAHNTGKEKSDTPESVKRFMKKVNRIRFNSLTSHLSEPAVYVVERSAQSGRARSCPPLRRKPLISPTGLNASSGSRRSAANSSKLETVSESAIVMRGKGEGICIDDGGFLASQELCPHPFGNKEGSSEAGSGMQTKSCPCQKGERSLQYVLDLANIFRSLLVPVKLAVCRQCQQVLVRSADVLNPGIEPVQQPGTSKPEGGWTSWPVASRCLYSSLSPPELLDRHLLQGKELHAKELSHIPLTSNETISWTHFGGGPPADEINILRGQKLMLQNQLMYERHKRSNHAMRNRRLLRRIAHVSALEEQVQALTHQLEVQAKDVQNLQVSLKLLQDHNHHLLQAKDSDQYEKLVDFKTTIQQNKDLQEANMELKNLLLSQKAENDDLRKELQSVRARCFELEKDNEILQGEMASVAKWKTQVVQLQKELLLMGEAHERLHRQIQQQQRLGLENAHLVSDMVLLSLKAEVKELKKERNITTLALETAKQRLGESEESLKLKDLASKDIKHIFDAAKVMFAEQVKAVEEKYQTMVRLNQQLESQVLALEADNSSMQQKVAALRLQLSRYQSTDLPPHAQAPPSGMPSPSPSSSGGGGGAEELAGQEKMEGEGPVNPAMEAKEEAAKRKKNSGKEKKRDKKAEAGTGRRKEPQAEERAEGFTSSGSATQKDSSHPSKDGGRSSLFASKKTAKCDSPSQGSTSYASAATVTALLTSTLSGLQSSNQALKSVAGKSDKMVSTPDSAASHSTLVKGANAFDVVSESSDAAQGLEESRAMLYTDSDGSQSFDSIFTADSGIDSKATG